MKHCRNFVCFIPSTNGFRKSITVDSFPECRATPALSPFDHLTAILSKLKDALEAVNQCNLFQHTGAEFIQAVKELHEILRIGKAATTSKGDSNKDTTTSKGESTTKSHSRPPTKSD